MWQLQLYPSGIETSSRDVHREPVLGEGECDDIVAVFVHNVKGHDIYAETTFILRDASGGVTHSPINQHPSWRMGLIVTRR